MIVYLQTKNSLTTKTTYVLQQLRTNPLLLKLKNFLASVVLSYTLV